MVDIGQGLYGFYQGLQPNRRQGDEIAEKHVERMSKKRALDLEEERLKPKPEKEEKVKYTGEAWETAPKNWSNIAQTLQNDFERMAVEIQEDESLTRVEKKVRITRLESNPDALFSLWKDWETLIKRMDDPAFVDQLDAAKASEIRTNVAALIEGEFEVSVDYENDNKLKITDRDDKEFSIRTKGLQLDGYKSELALAQGEYSRKKKFGDLSNFRDDAYAQYDVNGRRKEFTDTDVALAYRTGFEDIYGKIVPDADAKDNPYNKTETQAKEIMFKQYNQDFNKPNPYAVTKTTEAEKVKPRYAYTPEYVTFSVNDGKAGGGIVSFGGGKSEGNLINLVEQGSTKGGTKSGVAVIGKPTYMTVDHNGNITQFKMFGYDPVKVQTAVENGQFDAVNVGDQKVMAGFFTAEEIVMDLSGKGGPKSNEDITNENYIKTEMKHLYETLYNKARADFLIK